MPSKGVQLYTYIGAEGCQVQYTVPGSSIAHNEFNQWFNDHLEVDKAHINGTFNFVGRFEFQVKFNNDLITSQWVDVNTMTGNLESGTMKAIVDQRSVITNDHVVTYGFYDAGSGEEGLPKSHQCYVTITPNRSNWQGTLAPAGSQQETKPFAQFVLPAAHDIGMNSMETPDTLIQNASSQFLEVLKGIPIISSITKSMSEAILAGVAPDIIRSLAITQKDVVADVLTIGARYFEFRPAHLHKDVLPHSQLPDRLYFTHGPIPGMAFDHFLQDCISFLMAHPLEIIVVQLRWDGVPDQCTRPGDEEIAGYVGEALRASNNTIIAGSLDDMQRLSIADLRNQHKRLILFKEAGNILSTYGDEANATLNGDSIIAAFEQLNASQQDGKCLTNIQCQATASNIKDVVVYSVMTANVSNSCLMATKALCDSKTLAWIRSNALERLTQNQLILIMNDFIDGATAECAIDLSKRRLS